MDLNALHAKRLPVAPTSCPHLPSHCSLQFQQLGAAFCSSQTRTALLQDFQLWRGMSSFLDYSSQRLSHDCLPHLFLTQLNSHLLSRPKTGEANLPTPSCCPVSLPCQHSSPCETISFHPLSTFIECLQQALSHALGLYQGTNRQAPCLLELTDLVDPFVYLFIVSLPHQNISCLRAGTSVSLVHCLILRV